MKPCMLIAAMLVVCALALKAAAQEEKINYDEAKAGQYTLPDPLVMRDGTRVTDAPLWRQRRQELLELFQSQVYGRRMADPRRTQFHVTESSPAYLQGKAVRKQVRVEMTDEHGATASLAITMYVPRAAGRRAPAFVGMHLFDTAAAEPVPGKLLEENVGEPLPGAKVLEVILSRGYAIGTLDAKDFCPDDKARFREGLLATFFPDRSGPLGPEEAGAISSWAWALSRALDYCQQDPDIDGKHVTVIGHSRMGKTALWAGAQDERFALVISNNSGCGGAALNRRDYGETVERITRVFPHWFCGNFSKYAGKEQELPIDQHELIALVAPRPVYVASAVEDRWADPRGEFLAAQAAEPVYRLLGQPTELSDPPPANRSIGSAIGYHVRAGKHALTDYDWLKYLDFADRHFGRSK